MKAWILAAALLGACASGAPAPSSESATPPAASTPNYADARSTASEEDIRLARRAYRDACRQGGGSADLCECTTASMAQALSPADLSLATAQLTGQNAAVSGPAQSRISQARTTLENACARYRSN